MHDVMTERAGEGRAWRASEVAALGWQAIDEGLRGLARREAAHAYEVGQFLLAARRLATCEGRIPSRTGVQCPS